MSSTERYGRRSTISTSKTCGCHSSAIPPISSPPGCRYTKPDMPGGTFVSIDRGLGPSRDMLTAKWDAGASMTLVGLLPPLCDNGSMLVDGGYSRWLHQQPRTCADLITVDNLAVRHEILTTFNLHPTNFRSLPCLPWVQVPFSPVMPVRYVG